ncbi:TPA_asm: integrase [Geoglobus acetivorans pleomorphic virus 1]|uniref:Phage integrase n=2 Tax=root TaxID=1 RepID=A0A0A7GHM6_GEOAI|nr:Phage integrase [Geoglobus acetivorans]
MEFKKSLLAEGIGRLRIARYLSILRVVANWIEKPMDEWGEKEIVDVLSRLEEMDYAVGTKNEYRKAMRKFFKWLHGEDWKYLKLLKKIRKPEKKPVVLSEGEIIEMIEAADNPRDKALIAVGYEGGFRIGELGNLKIKDIIWVNSSNGELKARVKVKGKTGERVVPLVLSAQYLWRWLENHPNRDDPESYVFCSLSQRNWGEPMQYQSFRKIIEKVARQAGIKKRVYPHILRHSRATVLANHLTEAQMCEYFGWVQGSGMPAIYVHLSGRDIDKAIDKLYGLEDEEREDTGVKPKKCPRCGYLNAPTDFYCGRCALILDESKRVELEMEEMKFMKEVMDMMDPETIRKAKEMVELVEKMRSNPELFNLLLQIRD